MRLGAMPAVRMALAVFPLHLDDQVVGVLVAFVGNSVQSDPALVWWQGRGSVSMVFTCNVQHSLVAKTSGLAARLAKSAGTRICEYLCLVQRQPNLGGDNARCGSVDPQAPVLLINPIEVQSSTRRQRLSYLTEILIQNPFPADTALECHRRRNEVRIFRLQPDEIGHSSASPA